MSSRITGSVARVEDQHALIINRGRDHGVVAGMLFAVMADEGDEIVDPETGDVIGELPTEKLRLKVSEVHERWCRAETFVNFVPKFTGIASMADVAGITGPGVLDPKYSTLLGMDGIGAGLAEKIAGIRIGESLSQSILDGVNNPRPIRQKIANSNPQPLRKQSPVRREVTVNIGDKVQQIE